MDFGHYADEAAALASADLSSVETLRGFLAEREWLAVRLSSTDAKSLRRFQCQLRAVINDAEAGRDQAVVERINLMLETNPLRPRISGHDAQTWHLHINDSTDSVAAVLIGEALYGMTLAVTEYGADRFGWCADESCDNAFFDATGNRSKRFCSPRCASRTNVAAFRRRQSESLEAQR